MSALASSSSSKVSNISRTVVTKTNVSVGTQYDYDLNYKLNQIKKENQELRYQIADLKQIIHKHLMESKIGVSLNDITKLQYRYNDLKECYDYIMAEVNEEFKLKKEEQQLVDKTFQRISYPPEKQPDYDNEYLRTLIFITLTFDPEKFSPNNDSEDERNYLLHLIAQLVESKNLYQIYGSFEYQKNGSVHCHFISRFSDYGLIYKTLKRGLTNRPRNDKAVDIKPVHSLEKLWNYINKNPDNDKIWFTTNYEEYYGSLDYIPFDDTKN